MKKDNQEGTVTNKKSTRFEFFFVEIPDQIIIKIATFI